MYLYNNLPPGLITFSHPPNLTVPCVGESGGRVGDGPKGRYLSNFRRLQKEQPRAARARPPLRDRILREAYFDLFRKVGIVKELRCLSFHHLREAV